MASRLSHTDLSLEENYLDACRLIDVRSFAEYYAANIYTAHCYDWPSMNKAAWRSVRQTDSSFGDGRWRWLSFDTNGECMTANYTAENTLSLVNSLTKAGRRCTSRYFPHSGKTHSSVNFFGSRSSGSDAPASTGTK